MAEQPRPEPKSTPWRFALIGGAALAFLAVIDTGALSEWQEPYGGCIEGHRYLDSQGARECREHGWTIEHDLVVDPEGNVLLGTPKRAD